MTREEIAPIVCGCFGSAGVVPPDWDSACEGTRIGTLGLSSEGKLTVILCIREHLRAEGCDVALGESDLKDDITIGQLIDVVLELHWC